MKISTNIKNYSLFAYIVSFIVLVLFLLLGLILTIFFVQNLFTSISGFGLMQILFFIIGIYLIYKPARHIRSLLNNRNKFDKIFNNFVDKNKKAITLTVILSAILLLMFYSGISHNLDFFIEVVLYLPMFLFKNLVFLADIFLRRFELMFLEPIIDLTLPISQIIFLFLVSKFISKFFKQKS
jgi:hypothetical protein